MRVAHLDGHARREATGHDARLADRDGLIRSVERVEGGAAHDRNEVLDPAEASAVKSIWFIPPESRNGVFLTPVYVMVKEL